MPAVSEHDTLIARSDRPVSTTETRPLAAAAPSVTARSSTASSDTSSSVIVIVAVGTVTVEMPADVSAHVTVRVSLASVIVSSLSPSATLCTPSLSGLYVNVGVAAV